MNFLKRFMFFFDYVLPFPLFVLMFYLWYLRAGHNPLFACYVLVLPLLFGYIVPGVGTNILKLWRFTGKWMIGSYYWHHGFIYAGPLALILYITFGCGPVSTLQAVTIILCNGGMQGLLSFQHDTMAVKVGALIIDNPPAKQGKSAEEIVNYLNTLFFFLLGASYAGACIYAYGRMTQERVVTVGEFAWLLLVGLALIGIVPSVPTLLIFYHRKKMAA